MGAISIAPDPGGGARFIGERTPATSASVGGGAWKAPSAESLGRRAAIEAGMNAPKDSIAGRVFETTKKKLGLATATAPGGGTQERALPQEAIDQQATGNTLALVLAGAGVVGTGIALARGGAWWVSALLLPAAGAAYYLTRFKVPAPVKS